MGQHEYQRFSLHPFTDTKISVPLLLVNDHNKYINKYTVHNHIISYKGRRIQGGNGRAGLRLRGARSKSVNAGRRGSVYTVYVNGKSPFKLFVVSRYNVDYVCMSM